jgi:hypothetical protein
LYLEKARLKMINCDYFELEAMIILLCCSLHTTFNLTNHLLSTLKENSMLNTYSHSTISLTILINLCLQSHFLQTSNYISTCYYYVNAFFSLILLFLSYFLLQFQPSIVYLHKSLSFSLCYLIRFNYGLLCSNCLLL